MFIIFLEIQGLQEQQLSKPQGKRGKHRFYDVTIAREPVERR